MENKAHYTLIGAFVLATLISLFIFLIWLAKFDIDQRWAEYDIQFEESVFGLTDASPVTYNGIPVGDVLDISLMPNDPSKVVVTIKIKEETPIREDTEATLGMQGITGVLFVQIIGGEANSPPLKPKPGQDRPVIPSRASTMEEFFGGSGDLIKNAMETFERLNRIMSDDNINRISGTLDNVQALSNNLAAEGETIQETLRSLRDTLTAANDMLNSDLKPAAGEFKKLAANANSLVERLDSVLAATQGDFTDFSHSSLSELGLLIGDLRSLTQSLTDLSERLEDQPSEIIWKRKDPEYEAKE